MDPGIGLAHIYGVMRNSCCHIFSFHVILVIFLSMVINLPAEGSDPDEEAFIARQEERIASTSYHDWKTYADCVRALVERRIKTEEALQWIDHSIEIRETIYNLEIKGDYLVLSGQVREGQKHYVRAIELAREEGKAHKVGEIQWKILISMGVDNYNRFYGIQR